MKSFVRDNRIYLYNDIIFENCLWDRTNDPQPLSDTHLRTYAEAVIELFDGPRGGPKFSLIKDRFGWRQRIFERRELPRILKLIQKKMKE